MTPSSMRAALAGALVSAALAAPVAAQEVQSGTYGLDKTHATILWEVKHLGLSAYVGRMNAFDINLTLDADNPENSTVSATVEASSVSTPFPGEKDFDGEVGNDARFLNGAAFPEVTFTSTRVEPVSNTEARIIGDLTMLGVTREITLDATLTGAIEQHPFANAPAVGFEATTVIDRTAFGMDFLAPTVVAPEVAITVHAEFVKSN